MTKGQIEAKISEVVSKFEMEYVGRGPKQIKTIITEDIIVIRLVGFLSPTEKKLAQTKEGVELIKKVRSTLFESAKDELGKLIKEVIDVDIAGIYSDVNTTNGEKVIVVTLNENLEKRLK
ncbi:DUF2294 domain-containing protein [Caldicellulosiruptor morganii]|nr:DUF2294 domain-containing protein [Caldicellulosiruptor morganii]